MKLKDAFRVAISGVTRKTCAWLAEETGAEQFSMPPEMEGMLKMAVCGGNASDPTKYSFVQEKKSYWARFLCDTLFVRVNFIPFEIYRT